MNRFAPPAFVLAAAVVLALPAAAVVDPQPDGVGVYFDHDADVFETTVGTATPFTAYVMLTRPTRPDFDGMEFAYRVAVPAGTGGLIYRLGVSLPPGWICLMCEEGWQPLAGNVRLAGFPTLPTAEATVLMAWDYMILIQMDVDFHLSATPFTGPDSGRLAYRSGGAWVPMQVSSGDPALPVASVYGSAVPVVPARFGAVKALYR